jgi:hypothetical protein
MTSMTKKMNGLLFLKQPSLSHLTKGDFVIWTIPLRENGTGAIELSHLAYTIGSVDLHVFYVLDYHKYGVIDKSKFERYGKGFRVRKSSFALFSRENPDDI